MGVSRRFSPLTREIARDAIKQVLQHPPRAFGVRRTRWRLQDLGQALPWLTGYSVSGISRVLQQLGFSHKLAERFIRSPDPFYWLKWQQVLAAYQDAVSHPTEAVLLFQDELTYYRRPVLRTMWQQSGQRNRTLRHRPGGNTRARLTIALQAITGQVLYRQRATIGRKELGDFYGQIRAAFPQVPRLYLVQDNWPIHKHPYVLKAAADQQLRLLFLPTYASWLNPAEKLFRALRQDVLHNHELGHEFLELRRQVEEWLAPLATGSLRLLWLVGLLTTMEYRQSIY